MKKRKNNDTPTSHNLWLHFLTFDPNSSDQDYPGMKDLSSEAARSHMPERQTSLKRMTIKTYLSKELTSQIVFLLVLCFGVVVFNAYNNSFVDRNHFTLLIAFGLPLFFFSFLILNKNTSYREVEKSPSKEKLVELPFTSSNIWMVFTFSSMIISFGLFLCLLEKESVDHGTLTLTIGIVGFIFAGLSHDHPKIWFADSVNLKEESVRFENTPKENFPPFQDGIFSYDIESFKVTIRNEAYEILWTEVEKILSYKVDLITHDCIVIEIYAQNNFHRINDQTVGYMKFMEEASERLSNFKTDWFGVVAYPPFEQNLTVVYEKD